MAVCFCLTVFSQTLKTISWEDTTRQYLEYVPETYDASTPTPVVFIFHGLGGNIYEVLYNADFNRIAAEQGWITITPQALPDTFSAMDKEWKGREGIWIFRKNDVILHRFL